MRPSWDEYFIGIARAVSARADCTRRQVGAVCVDEGNRILGTGYNGAAPGGPSCLEGECPRGRMSREDVPPGSGYESDAGRCIATHAEVNALLYSTLPVATLYITDPPCEGCFKVIAGAAVPRVVHPEGDGLKVYQLMAHVQGDRIRSAYRVV